MRLPERFGESYANRSWGSTIGESLNERLGCRFIDENTCSANFALEFELLRLTAVNDWGPGKHGTRTESNG